LTPVYNVFGFLLVTETQHKSNQKSIPKLQTRHYKFKPCCQGYHAPMNKKKTTQSDHTNSVKLRHNALACAAESTHQNFFHAVKIQIDRAELNRITKGHQVRCWTRQGTPWRQQEKPRNPAGSRGFELRRR
jgi:hypothetical protein